MASLYESAPMPKPNSQIRLLKLETHNSEEDFSYKLQTFDFDDNCPDYIAVSYTWGDVAPIMPLTVNGFIIYVRLNCWYALWQIRNAGYKTFLWIDSITIDQSITAEKNHQVAMMGDIFRQATSVAACIGNSQILSHIRDLHRDLNHASHDFPHMGSSHVVHTVLSTFPYWQRAWIVQEIVLARRVELFCGPATMTWDAFETAWTQIHPCPTGADEIDGAILDLLAHRRQYQSHADSLDSFNLINRSLKLQCYDVRDRIYAFRSLLSPEDPLRCNIALDYAQSPFLLAIQVQLVLTQVLARKHEEIPVAMLRQLFDLFRIEFTSDETQEWIQGLSRYQHQLSSILSPSHFKPAYVTFRDPSPILAGQAILAILKNEVSRGFLSSRHEPIAGLSQSFPLHRHQIFGFESTEAQHANLEGTQRVKILCLGPQAAIRATPFSTSFLVHEDVQVNDLLMKVLFFAEPDKNIGEWKANYAHAVLRSKKRQHREKDGADTQSCYTIHSWCLPLQGTLTLAKIEQVVGSNLASVHPQPPNTWDASPLWGRAGDHFPVPQLRRDATVPLRQEQLTRFLMLANDPASSVIEARDNTFTAVLDEAASSSIEQLIITAYRETLCPLVRAINGHILTEVNAKRVALKNFLKSKSGTIIRSLALKDLDEAEPMARSDLMNTLSEHCSRFLGALEEGESDPDRHANLTAIFDLFIAVLEKKAQ